MGKRMEWPLESVAVAPMISPIQCGFSLFFFTSTSSPELLAAFYKVFISESGMKNAALS